MVNTLRNNVPEDIRHIMLEPEPQIQQPLGRHHGRAGTVEILTQPASKSSPDIIYQATENT